MGDRIPGSSPYNPILYKGYAVFLSGEDYPLEWAFCPAYLDEFPDYASSEADAKAQIDVRVREKAGG